MFFHYDRYAPKSTVEGDNPARTFQRAKSEVLQMKFFDKATSRCHDRLFPKKKFFSDTIELVISFAFAVLGTTSLDQSGNKPIFPTMFDIDDRGSG